MSEIKVGLLGAGYILQAHAKALAAVPSVRMHAVCDVSRERAEAAARSFGVQNVYTTLDELLNSDCDVVHILLPPFLHEDAALRLLRSGKSVFLEKPMGLSSATCQEVVDLGALHNLRVGVNHNFLFLPGYELLRQAICNGHLGPLDHVSMDWLYSLGLIQFGPHNNWMLATEANLLYELGAHLAAFATDLLGRLDDVTAVASLPILLPGQQQVFRHWNAVGHKGNTSVSFNLSVYPGQPSRCLHVRGVAGAAHFDFERDHYWMEHVQSNSAMIDQLQSARATAAQVRSAGWFNLKRYLKATLARQANTQAFQDSISRSVAQFYATLDGPPDPRLDGQFGVEVIRLCERIVESAGVSPASPPRPISTIDVPPVAVPTVLVVGGTGFIGKRLVQALSEAGVGVRVLTRSLASARLALNGIPVELVQGDHGDRSSVSRALQGIDVVYHLAKAVGQRWEDYLAGDVEPTRVLAEAAIDKGISRFIYTGTIDSYYTADGTKTIDSDTPLDPNIHSRNLYARSKATCEDLLMKLHRERGLPLVVFRPGVVIGEGSPPAHWGVGMFHSDTRAQLWGDGNSKLPLVLVDEVAQGLALGMRVPGIEGQSFLLTGEPLLTAREYIREVEIASRMRISATPTPIWRFYLLDVVKEAIKHLVKHPNRRRPSYRDWNCRAHRSKFDASKTKMVLGWRTELARESLVEKGIAAAVRQYFQ